MKTKGTLILILSLMALSCSQKILKLNSIEKRITYPGVVSASPFIVYEIAFESSNEFKIDEVLLNDQTSIASFSVYSEATRSYLDGSGSLRAGKYTLSFKISDLVRIDETDEISLSIVSNDNKEEKTAKVVLKDPIRLR